MTRSGSSRMEKVTKVSKVGFANLNYPSKEFLSEIIMEAQHELIVTIDDGVVYSNLAEPYTILRTIYQQLTDLMFSLGKPLLDIRILVKAQFCNVETPIVMSRPLVVATPPSSFNYKLGQFQVVAIGGTFDRLHAGHKLMLSVAAMLASQSVVCGVTDDDMMTCQKSFKEKIEAWDLRAGRVRSFLAEFAPPNLSIGIIRLTDPFGPTINSEDVDALVVSPETLSGGQAINKIRKERGMAELEIISIDLISISTTPAGIINDKKLSSTLLRSYL